MDPKDEIREFIRDLLAGNGDSGELADDDSILLSGRLQSINAVEIVIFLEDKYGIDFAEIGFDRDQIDSVNAIYALVQAVPGHA